MPLTSLFGLALQSLIGPSIALMGRRTLMHMGGLAICRSVENRAISSIVLNNGA